MSLLALHAVSKSYGALKVTDNISLSVAQGETLGILGPNGAGKTTLFNLISGDTKVDAGRGVFKGDDMTAVPPGQLSRVFASPGIGALAKTMTVARAPATPCLLSGR